MGVPLCFSTHGQEHQALLSESTLDASLLTKHAIYGILLAMDRTVQLELQPTSEQSDALHTTLQQFTAAYNFVCAYGWNAHEKNGVRLHHATYYDTKARCTGLVSDLLIQARVKATETLKSAFTWKAKKEAAYPKRVAKAQKMGWKRPVFKPVKCPQSEQCAIRYNVHTSTLDWTQQRVRLSTSAGKMTIGFRIPRFSQKYVGHPIATADLCYRQGRWWLHVVVDVPEPPRVSNDTLVGVDLGLNRPAVTSTRQFLGTKRWKERDRRFFRLKRKLQSIGAQKRQTSPQKDRATAGAVPPRPRSCALQTHRAQRARRDDPRL
jgi:putative transposase